MGGTITIDIQEYIYIDYSFIYIIILLMNKNPI